MRPSSNVFVEHVAAVQNERDHIRVRRPSYIDSAANGASAVSVRTLHTAEMLSRDVSIYIFC